MKTQQCLTDHELSDFDLGNLQPEQYEEASNHLEICPTCAARFENLDQQADDVLGHLHLDLPKEILSDDSELDRLVGAAAALHDTSVAGQVETLGVDIARKKPALEQIVSRILSPAESDGEMGRLGGYRVLDVLGKGGMGIVFKAEDVGLKRLVALKAMLPHIAMSSDSARERFVREAQATAAIHHDNIVTIHQVVPDGEVPFLAMHLLEGESLGMRLKREEVVPLDEACRIVREAAQGLAAAHGKGLTHRDIKPDNLWLEAGTGRVKIVDFGLARAIDDQANLTQSGEVVGTPSYLAPEQALGQSIDARVDLFSLGVVFYQMLTGNKPFERENTIATLRAIDSETPPSPASLRDEVPGALSDLVMRLLEKVPDQRFQSASDLVEAIHVVEETPAAPVVLSESRKARPRRGTLVAIAAVAALLLVAGVVFIVRDKQGNIIAKIFGPAGSTVERVSEDPKTSGDKTTPRVVAPPVEPSRNHLPALGPLALVQQPTRLISKDGDPVQSHTLDTLPIMGATTAAVSPDGKHVATFSDDGMIRIWDPHSRELVQLLVGHTAGPPRRNIYVDFDSLAWNSDNRRLAALDTSGELRVWDTTTGKTIFSYKHEKAKIRTYRWSPDGSLLATLFDDQIGRILDSQGKLVSKLEHPPGSPWHLAWSPDSKTLATSLYRDPFIYLWDIQSGKGKRIKCPAMIYPDGLFNIALSWSSDSKQVAACCNQFVVVCDVASGAVQQVLDQLAHTVAWSLDGSELFVGLATGQNPDDSYQIVRIESGKETQRIEIFKNSSGVPYTTSITPLTDGQHLLVKFFDGGNRLVNLKTAESRQIGGQRFSFVFASRDGSVCALSGSKAGSGVVGVMTDAVESDQALNWIPLLANSGVERIACSERFIATIANNGGALIDRNTGRVVRRFERLGGSGATAILFSPDTKHVFIGETRGNCRIVALDGSHLADFQTEEFVHDVRAAAYSLDGKEIAIVGHLGVSIHDALDGALRLSWKFADGLTGRSSIAWSPDGTLLAVTTDMPQLSRVHIYDAKTGEEKQSLSEFPEFGEPMGPVTWSPDGKYLAVTSDWGDAGIDPDPRWFNQLVVWETSQWKAVLTRPVPATALRFDDNTTLVYATRDGRVTYEKVETGKELRSVQAGAGGQLTTFTPDGKQVLHVNGARVSVWRLDEGTLQATILPNLGDKNNNNGWAVISTDGYYFGSPVAYKHLRHIVRTKNETRVLTPFDFRNEFDWKNDPSKVRLK